MARSPKMTVCKTCNEPIAANAKVCPHCGAKNRKPIYKRGWFILLLVVAVLTAASCAGGRDSGKTADEPALTPIPESTKAPATAQPTEEPETEEAPAEETPVPEASAEEPTEAPTEEPETVDGMRPEFKEAMDSYEAFYDEYCEFMKEYNDNPSDLKLLAKYAEMMTRLADMDEKFDAWEDEDLNTEETKYYIEVQSRITTKLLDVASAIG